MKRVFQIVEILDPVLVDKLIYLDRLVKVYAKFLKTWRFASVKTNGKLIVIRFFLKDKDGYISFTEREIPIEDLQKRIDSYKRKVRDEFSKRHSNTRIQREKEIYKWKKVIEDAKLRMSE